MKKNIKTTKNKKIMFKLTTGALVISAIAVPNFFLYDLNKDFEKTKTEKTNLKNNLDLINSKLTNFQTTIENLEKENRLNDENLKKLKQTLKETKDITKAINVNVQLINVLLNDSIKQINNLRPRLSDNLQRLYLNLLNNNIKRIMETLKEVEQQEIEKLKKRSGKIKTRSRQTKKRVKTV